MKLSLFEDYQPIAAIAVTPSGLKRLLSLCDATDAILWIPASCQNAIDGTTHPRVQVYTDSLTDHLAKIWPDYRDFIFCLATGAVVRAIAPLLQHQSIDPAVVVVDEVGKFTRSLCSGHQGVADSLTQAVAYHFGATPVLTDASRVWISATQRQFAPNSEFPKVQWHPRILWVGVGCARGTSRRVVETAIAQVCQSRHFAQGAIAGIATIDNKADEVGLLELCEARQWPLKTFSSEVLKSVTVPTPSTVVGQKIGTPSVAEAAAIVAAQGFNSPGETSNSLLVSKQIFRLEGESGAVTVAIAQAEREYTRREEK
ncbi:cobalamin biosynthesis protein [Laspinema sp. D1]|uniref:Cobalamin biosynthesis protein n=1 Tax=Laspinema palackyanum D2a TaxID=2953684 RepID=A0ABT2MZF3_9CYAN|nr:cobalamin biosynthesis protein [Laspinema sp. D2a]